MTYALGIHIAFGAVALVLGPIAMRASKYQARHASVGEWYHWIMPAVCVTAVLLVEMDFRRLEFFLYISIWSYLFALVGYLSAKLRWRRWLVVHVIAQCLSYLALVIAVFATSWEAISFGTLPQMVGTLLPQVIGIPLIVWIAREVVLGRRPKA